MKKLKFILLILISFASFNTNPIEHLKLPQEAKLFLGNFLVNYLAKACISNNQEIRRLDIDDRSVLNVLIYIFSSAAFLCSIKPQEKQGIKLYLEVFRDFLWILGGCGFSYITPLPNIAQRWKSITSWLSSLSRSKRTDAGDGTHSPA